MKYNNIYLWVFLLLVLIISSGCQETAEIQPTPTNTLESPTPTPTIAPTATNDPTYLTNDGIVVGANLNCPDRAAFGHINEYIPAKHFLVSDPILFRWNYICGLSWLRR